MTMTLHLADVDVLAGTLEDHQPAGAQIAVLKAANVALDAGDTVLAVRLCQTALGQGPVHPLVAANLTMVMVAAGADDAARVWQDDLLAQLSAGLTDLPADARRRISLGRLLAVLGRTEAAEAALAGALPDCPADQPGVLALSALFVKSGRPSQVVDLWQPLIAASVDRGARHLDLVKILAATGHGQVARQELAKAAPFCGHIRAEYDQIAAALTGGQAGNQAAATLNVFDRFATGYDAALEKLGNQGPVAVQHLLVAVGLPAQRKLAVLDAGCGTGLCGPVLRAHARRLTGVDLSAPMLGQARKKRCYDALARCDLSVLGTYPDGPFDLLVSSDTLVYFGDLAVVLANMAHRIRPGGWLILTLEDGDTQPRPWLLTPAGRHCHRRDYLEQALQVAGFGRPRLWHSFTLRHEFGAAIAGVGVAVQRLALFA